MADDAARTTVDTQVAPAQTASRRPRIGLVIGSGSIKCASALGLLRVLERERIPVDLAVGCSAGGLYASALALGWELEATERRSHEMWQGLFARIDYVAIIRGLFPRLFPGREPAGLLDERRLNSVLESLYGEMTFRDARIPLYIVATDMKTGDSVILSMGFENPLNERVGSLMSLVAQTTCITMNNLLKSTYSFYNAAHHAEIVPIIPTFDRHIGLRDASLHPYMIERGEEAAAKQLPFLRRLLAGV